MSIQSSDLVVSSDSSLFDTIELYRRKNCIICLESYNLNSVYLMRIIISVHNGCAFGVLAKFDKFALWLVNKTLVLKQFKHEVSRLH